MAILANTNKLEMGFDEKVVAVKKKKERREEKGGHRGEGRGEERGFGLKRREESVRTQHKEQARTGKSHPAYGRL